MTESIVIDGNHIAYRFDGREDAPLLTLSNSLAADHRMWEAQMPALVPDWRVLRYDTRGHGASSAPQGPYTIAGLAGDIIGLWDALGIETSVFSGLSLGGMIGKQLAIENGQRLRALVLCDTIARWPGGVTAIWNGRVRAAQSQGMAPLVEPTLERWFTAPTRARRPPELEPIAAMIAATPPAGFIGCAQAIAKINFLDRLGTVGVPTLVIVGADDPATPPSAAQAIQAAIPGAELVVIEDAAHLANVEQPDAFNAALTGFLTRLAP